MTREELLRRDFRRDMRLLEIGPSYNPVLPKSDGWRTTVIDHAEQPELVRKYQGLDAAMVERIEPVDFIWNDGPLSSVIPETMQGSFDGLVASHVAEHFPDLISFFQSASVLMKSDGVMALALPDKRVCFDFFQPVTMTGDVLAAHAEGRIRHQPKTLFNQSAYQVTRQGRLGWAHSDDTTTFSLNNPFSAARQAFVAAESSPESEYRDSHAWVFTPKSFELLMLELNLLGEIDWAILGIEAASAVEFYAWLKQQPVRLSEVEVNKRRLALLLEMVQEIGDSVLQLESSTTPGLQRDLCQLKTEMKSQELRLAALESIVGRLMSLVSPARSIWRAIRPRPRH